MTFQRASFLAAAFLLAQHPQDVSSFSVNPLARTQQQRPFAPPPSTTAVRAGPSASEKAAELRKKAGEAKKRAEELKKIAEQKAEAAMVAVKKANDKQSAAAAKVEAKKPAPPASKPEAATKASAKVIGDPAAGAIIPINSDTIQFTSGVLGGAIALALHASPVLAVVSAAAANYVSKKDDLGEVSELIQSVSKTSLNTFNWFAKLDSKYTILGNLSSSLDKSLNDLKNSEGESAETVKNIEDSVSKTTNQIQQLAEEIDLIEGGKQLLGAFGDVLETTIDKAIGTNKEYKLTERAAEAAKKAIEKAKESKD